MTQTIRLMFETGEDGKPPTWEDLCTMRWSLIKSIEDQGYVRVHSTSNFWRKESGSTAYIRIRPDARLQVSFLLKEKRSNQ